MVIKKAYAKINLGLRILRKQGDGYHAIETLFHRINLSDILTFEEAKELSLTVSDQSLPADSTNLCLRAAELLQQKYGVSAGVHITLEKNIPVGAGLGGGSSDAASTLLALNEFWQLSLTETELFPLAVQLGSDVPYFLRSGSAYATGRGEILEYFTLELPYTVVLVYPRIHVDTAWAYKQYKQKVPRFAMGIKEFTIRQFSGGPRNRLLFENDFEDLVISSFPVIGKVKQQLLNHGASVARLTGSGSSICGFFHSRMKAQKALDELSRKYPTYMTESNFQPVVE